AERVAYFDQKIREQENRLAQRKTEVLPSLLADLPGKKPDPGSIRAGIHQDLIAHLNFDAGFSQQKTSGGIQKRVKDDKLRQDYPVRGSAELVSSIRGKALKAGAYDGMSLP